MTRGEKRTQLEKELYKRALAGQKPGCAVLRADAKGRGKHLAQPEP